MFLKFSLANDDINRTPGYQVNIRHFVQLFILILGLYLGLKSAKYLWRMHNKMSEKALILYKLHIKKCLEALKTK